VRILVLFAHPVETSFGAALHAKLVGVLRAGGHKVDDCDLNAEGFDPVMSRHDLIDYYNVAVNRRRVTPYVDRLLAAEAIVFSFPVWNMGLNQRCTRAWFRTSTGPTQFDVASATRRIQLDLALQELGRIERTLFMLDWLESPELRRRCQAGLNKGEQRHALAQAICYGIGPPPCLLEGDHSTSLVAATPLEPPFVMRSPLALFG